MQALNYYLINHKYVMLSVHVDINNYTHLAYDIV